MYTVCTGTHFILSFLNNFELCGCKLRLQTLHLWVSVLVVFQSFGTIMQISVLFDWAQNLLLVASSSFVQKFCCHYVQKTLQYFKDVVRQYYTYTHFSKKACFCKFIQVVPLIWLSKLLSMINMLSFLASESLHRQFEELSTAVKDWKVKSTLKGQW